MIFVHPVVPAMYKFSKPDWTILNIKCKIFQCVMSATCWNRFDIDLATAHNERNEWLAAQLALGYVTQHPFLCETALCCRPEACVGMVKCHPLQTCQNLVTFADNSPACPFELDTLKSVNYPVTHFRTRTLKSVNCPVTHFRTVSMRPWHHPPSEHIHTSKTVIQLWMLDLKPKKSNPETT